MTTIASEGKFKLSELGFEDSEIFTVKRVAREMEGYGWLVRDSPQSGIWRAGPKAKLIFDFDEETLEAARQ